MSDEFREYKGHSLFVGTQRNTAVKLCLLIACDT